jgi:PEP-CTERM motif
MNLVTSSRALWTACAFASCCASLPAAAQQAQFITWTLAGGWPASQMSAGADWSSDLGPDWGYGATSAPDGSSVSWSGQGRNWSSRPGYANAEANLTVGWELNARGGAVGNTFSGGQVSIGPQQVLDNGAVSSTFIHLWNELGANEPGFGISTNANHHGYASIWLGPQPLNLHWRLDWNIATTGNAISSTNVFFSGVFNQAISGTGSASGFWAYGGSPNGVWSRPDIQVSSFIGDNAGDPRAGRQDSWVVVSFSTQPITSAVPEPASWALMLAGVALLCARRQAARAAADPHRGA